MLADLRALIPSLTDATVAARAGGEPSYDLAEAGPPSPQLPIADYDRLNAGQVDNQVTVSGPAGTHTADDVDTLVILRSGFDPGEDGIERSPQAPAPAAAKTH